MDSSREDRYELICRMRGQVLDLKGLEHKDEIEERKLDTIKNSLILSSGIRRNAEIIA